MLSTAAVACLGVGLAQGVAAEPLSPQSVRIVARTDTAPEWRYHRVRHVRWVRRVHEGHVYYARHVYYTRVYYR
jgi:hypothetical protein